MTAIMNTKIVPEIRYLLEQIRADIELYDPDVGSEDLKDSGPQLVESLDRLCIEAERYL